MLGLMQDHPLLISSLIEHAAASHPDAEIVSRTVEGPLHRCTYRDVHRRSKQVANALAAGVVTWAFSPIKFQADMGILLTFMFLWNMLGALVLIPALSHFLLPTRPPAIASRKDAGMPASAADTRTSAQRAAA